MAFSGQQKRPMEGFTGALVSAKRPRQDLVPVSGGEKAKQLIQSVRDVAILIKAHSKASPTPPGPSAFLIIGSSYHAAVWT